MKEPPVSTTTGLLLINLGTPDAPEAPEVRRYLREFLGDPRVVDMSPLGRWLLLNLIILPFRPRRSAEAYREVWTERGSPLLFHSEDLAAEVQRRLGQGWRVALAMRYGRPSISEALERYQADGVDRIVVLPLYPQYASSTTGSTHARVMELASALPAVPSLVTVGDFCESPHFIGPAVAAGREAAAGADHVLFSFHGVPERQVQATEIGGGGHCLGSAGCCDALVPANRFCYRAQCFATARAMASALGLAPEAWSVSFQSRLGRVPWIRPYTDERVPELARAGVRHLTVFCPSFVADCLETLEEIGIRAEQDFREAGGEALTLVPCVNSRADWAEGVAALAREALSPPG
ncbi:MAG: ferrochelatase [Alphaproteobacteria bacterium]|nr:ferrochelatase [Alphaproteobacteria bacterium]